MAEAARDQELWKVVKRATADVIKKVLSHESDLEAVKSLTLEKLFMVDPSSRGDDEIYHFGAIDGIDDLVAAVDSRPLLREKFEFPDFNSENPYENPVILPHEVASIPITLASHCLAEYAGDPLDATLLSIYPRYERYLLGGNEKDLRADLLIPILGSNPQYVADVDSGCSIVPVDRDALSELDESVADHDLDIMQQAKCALLLRDIPVRVEGFGIYHYASPSVQAESEIDRFFEALNIESPGSVTWVQSSIKPLDWSAQYVFRDRRSAFSLRCDYATRIDLVSRWRGYSAYDVDLAKTENVLRFQKLLATCHKSVRVAARRLMLASTRSTDEDRVIDLCIGLEALLGSGFSETVHRLSMRSAALLMQLGWAGPSSALYAATRDLYAYRSRVVHGDPGPHKKALLDIGGVPIHATRFATAALSSLLRYTVADPSFDPARLDDRFIFSAFDALVAKDDGGDSADVDR